MQHQRLLTIILCLSILLPGHSVFGNPGKEIIELLDNGFSPNNIIPEYGWPAFFLAIEMNDPELVKACIKHGANPNSRFNFPWGYTGEPPVMSVLNQCIRKENIKLIKVLLEMGADPDFHGPQNRSPLRRAVDANNIEIIRLLLDAGADINKIDTIQLNTADDPYYSSGSFDVIIYTTTPLLTAVEQKKQDIVSLLLQHGAKTDIVYTYSSKTSSNEDPGETGESIEWEKNIFEIAADNGIKIE